MTPDAFAEIVARANLAPSVHNVQPARWRLLPDGVEILCDGDVALTTSDPLGRDAGLSCGAAVEATVLALSTIGQGVDVHITWAGAPQGRTLGPVARLTFAGDVAPLPLATQLENRATFRGPFEEEPAALFGWTPESAILVTDKTRIHQIAIANDAASLRQIRQAGVRTELRDWMRLSARHPRAGRDGMDRDALRMSGIEAIGAGLVLGPLWPLVDRLGLTKGLLAEADATRTAPVIAAFNRPDGEDPVTSGRAYLSMWLAATALGFAGWPMAALTDDPESRAEMTRLVALPQGRRLIQMIRFGKPTSDLPRRARRPISELIV